MSLPLQIRKYAVDNFSPGISIPACFLVVRCMREHQPPDLMHKVTLAGAREEDYFMLYIASGKEDSDVELHKYVYSTIHVHACVINTVLDVFLQI